MKSLKSKLMAAGAMLMVSVVMLTSASFAWFTVSTTAAAEGVTVNMEATKNIEIARKETAPSEVTDSDSGSEETWGNKITNLGTRTVNSPAKLDGTAIKSVQYAEDGRTNGLIEATAGEEYYTVGDRKVAAVYNNIWLRTNETKTITPVVSGATKFNAAFVDESGAASTVTLTGNTAKKVSLVLFVNGENFYASDAATGVAAENITVSFSIA